MKRYRIFILLLAGLSLLNACKKSSTSDSILVDTLKDQELLSTCLSAATFGIVSANEKIAYILNNSINNDLTKAQIQSIVEIDPQVEGEVSISHGTLIEFTPKDNLTSNTKYKVTLNLKDIGACQDNYTYTLQTFKQDFNVSRDGLRITNQGKQVLLLSVVTADYTSVDDLAKCFDTDADDLLVEEISPTKFSIEATWNTSWTDKSFLKYNGKPIQSDKKGSIDLFEIGTDNFAILFTKYNFSEKAFHAYFSKPINPSADLSGLVTANKKDVKYLIKDNQLTLYLSELRNEEDIDITFWPSIYSTSSDSLTNSYSFTIHNDVDKPSVEFLHKGNYFPSSGEFKIPIRARALEKVRMTIIEIKKHNRRHLMTWQSLNYSNYDNLRMYGKPIYDEVVDLKTGLSSNEGWNTYGIDLSDQISRRAGSIYNISLSFEPSFTTLSCKSDLKNKRISSKLPSAEFWEDNEEGYYNSYYYYDNYNWKERADPCKISYYRNKEPIRRYLLCSDLAYIVKKADNDVHVALTDLEKIQAVTNADVRLIDLQGEIITSVKSSKNGFAVFKNVSKNASLVEIEHKKQIIHVPLDPGRSNSLTEFDVSGNRSEEDEKFFIYTDRDVWRPGDSIYLDVMINSQTANLAKGLPIRLSFYNTENNRIHEQVTQVDLTENQIYPFILSTDKSAKSGRYYCIIDIGPQSLRKKIRIENIKPNTAEIIYSFSNEEEKVIYDKHFKAKIKAQYLNGFAAKNAKIKANGLGRPINTPFPNYKDYTFNTPHVKYPRITLYSVSVNENGEATIQSKYDFTSFNGPVQLSIETEINLSAGGVNKQGQSIKLSPFESYVGAKKSVGSGYSNNYLLEEAYQISVIRLDKYGHEATSSAEVSYQLDKHIKYWWIDKYRLAHNSEYTRSSAWSHHDKGSLTLTSSGQIKFAKKQLAQGAYRLTITDNASGHQCQVHFSVYDGSQRIPGSQPFIIQVETDKDEYTIDEQIDLRLPGIKGAKALVSIERGNLVLEQVWYDLKEQKSSLMLTPGKDWSPNVYLHVTIIQKYGQDQNDLPLRMYGIRNITIDGSHTQLNPIVSLPEKLRSDKTYRFEVSEESGKKMEYTLAIVDEGLLNLTGFKTPNPFDHFNGKYPLLVKTWDIYQSLIAYFKGDYAGILSIGGDDAYTPDEIPEISRFESVVIHQGPFKIGENTNQTHEITIPNYIGKVRLMVVGCDGRNFGKLERKIPIANPLMIQSQFPRALNVSDKMELPITLFRDDKNISTATLTSSVTKDYVRGFSPNTTIDFDGEDQVTHLYDIEVLDKTGVLDVDLEVKGNDEIMNEHTQIAINYPNSYQSNSATEVIAPGDSLLITTEVKGYPSTYTKSITVSGVLAPAFTKYAEELIRYPYGCLEQTTSTGFSQLYLDKIVSLSPAANRKRLENIQTVMNKIARFQRSDGHYAYWRGGNIHPWSNNYVGNYLLEAQQLNYISSNSPMLKKWIKANQKSASDWSSSKSDDQYHYESQSVIQAYRLYILAKASNPSKSAMNRFVSTSKSKNPLVWWLMAGAYKLSGYETKALDLISKAENLKKSVEHYSRTFGNEARDLAIIVEILSDFDNQQLKIQRYYERMVDILNATSWASTQTKAYAFVASYKYYGSSLDINKEIQYQLTREKKKENYQYKPTQIRTYDISSNPRILNYIKNIGDTKLYIHTIDKYIDNDLFKKAVNKEINLTIYYYNITKGESNIKNLSLGDDISISVSIRNPSAIDISNLALNVKMPSGWELINPRLYETEKNNGRFEYQDFKDDRVYTFFNVKAGKKEQYNFLAKAAFTGDFYMPAVSCEHMYKGNITARTEANHVEIN